MSGYDAAAAGMQAVGAVVGGLNAKEAAKFNAAQQREQAKFVEAVGEQKKRAALREYGSVLASARASSAASGVSVRGDYAIFAEAAESYARNIASLEASTEFEASQRRTQAQAISIQGNAAKTSGVMQGIGLGLTALSSAGK